YSKESVLSRVLWRVLSGCDTEQDTREDTPKDTNGRDLQAGRGLSPAAPRRSGGPPNRPFESPTSLELQRIKQVQGRSGSLTGVGSPEVEVRQGQAEARGAPGKDEGAWRP